MLKDLGKNKVLPLEKFLAGYQMSSILVLSLVVVLDLELEKLDVKISFLHGELEEEIYME